MSRKSTIYWEVILLVITVGLILVKFSSDTLASDLLIGVLSALVLLLLFEIRELILDHKRFGYLEGVYKRTAIYNENKDSNVNTKWALRHDFKDVDPIVVLRYLGGSGYSIRASYDGNDKVAGVAFMDKENSKLLYGHYQYIGRTGAQTDIGDYRIQVDEQTKGQLFVFHEDLIPSGLSRGYEIWQLDRKHLPQMP